MRGLEPFFRLEWVWPTLSVDISPRAMVNNGSAALSDRRGQLLMTRIVGRRHAYSLACTDAYGIPSAEHERHTSNGLG